MSFQKQFSLSLKLHCRNLIDDDISNGFQFSLFYSGKLSGDERIESTCDPLKVNKIILGFIIGYCLSVDLNSRMLKIVGNNLYLIDDQNSLFHPLDPVSGQG